MKEKIRSYRGNTVHKYTHGANDDKKREPCTFGAWLRGIRFRKSDREESAFLFGERKYQIFLQLLRPQSILREVRTHR